MAKSVECHCLTCDKVFYKSPFTVYKDGRGKFCSKACLYKKQSERRKGMPGFVKSGSENPNWNTEIVVRKCPICTKDFRSRLKTCSIKCSTELRRKSITGDGNPYRKKHPPKIKTCRGCNKEFQRNGTRGLGKHYCSEVCSFKNLHNNPIQQWLHEKLLEQGFVVESEKRWKWLINPLTGYPLRVDLFLPRENIAIEYDGRQHYEEAFAGGPAELISIQFRDRYKAMKLSQQRISLIRLKGKIKSIEHVIELINERIQSNELISN